MAKLQGGETIVYYERGPSAGREKGGKKGGSAHGPNISLGD